MNAESIEPLEFRAADPQEIGAIALLIARANAGRDGEPVPEVATEDQIEDLRVRMGRPHAWTCVAVDQGEAVGFALGYPRTNKETPPEAADTEYLSLLMVEPGAQGKGVGSRLLDTVSSYAREVGRDQVTLWTAGQNNDHARTFYENRGFEPTNATRLRLCGQQVEYKLDLRS